LIGFDKELNDIIHAYKIRSVSYPFYDILKLNEDTYKVLISIAGFSKKDIKISLDNRHLIVEGILIEIINGELIYKGIPGCKFVKSFVLGQYMEVCSAKIQDGILDITLSNARPKEKKPKTIKIK
jgi:molecular chaperone IbpA